MQMSYLISMNLLFENIANIALVHMIPCWLLSQLFHFPKLTWIMDDSEKKEIIITTPCEFNPRKWAVGAPPLPWQVPVPPWTALPPPMPYSTTPVSIILLRSPPHPTPPYHTNSYYLPPYHLILPPTIPSYPTHTIPSSHLTILTLPYATI